MLALGLGLLAALGWGTHDLLVRRIAPGATILPQIVTVMCVAALVTLPVAPHALPPLWPLALSFASGGAFLAAMLALYAAFARAPARLVAPVIGAYPLPSLAIAAMQGHAVSLAEWLSAALIVGGVAVVATTGAGEDRRTDRRALPLAFAACLLMATSIAFGQEAALRLPPLEAASLARLSGALLGLVLLGLRPAGTRAALIRWPTLVAMGCLDGMALSAVIAAGSLPDATYAAVASSLFGVVTILLAWAFLKEAVRPAQAAGIALIFTGLARLAWS